MTTPPSGLPADAGQPQRPPAEVASVLKTAAAAPQQQQEPGSSGLTPDEEAELARLTAKAAEAAAGPDTVRLRVEEPHAEMIFGGITIGREFTDVPAHMAGPLSTAAADAGVKITQEG